MALTHAITHEIQTLPGYVAGEDLTTKQFYHVKEHTDGTAILVDAGGADACMLLGIVLNKPYTGEEVKICRGGICPVKLGATVTKFQTGMVDVSDSTAILATDGAIQTCRFLTGGTDGEIIPAEILIRQTAANVSLENTGA